MSRKNSVAWGDLLDSLLLVFVYCLFSLGKILVAYVFYACIPFLALLSMNIKAISVLFSIQIKNGKFSISCHAQKSGFWQNSERGKGGFYIHHTLTATLHDSKPLLCLQVAQPPELSYAQRIIHLLTIQACPSKLSSLLNFCSSLLFSFPPVNFSCSFPSP